MLVGLGAAAALVLTAGCERQAAGDDLVAGAIERSGPELMSPSHAEGRRLFATYCATCHGESGKGDGQNASRLSPRPPDLTASVARLSPQDFRRLVEHGTAAEGRTPLCPPHGSTLGRARTDVLLAYLRTLAP